MKKIILIILGAIIILGIGTLFMLRVLTPEDDWICDNGNWVKHGNPSAEKPSGTCK